MLKSTPNLFDPEFARQFTRFTAAYDVFTRHAALSLSSVHPNSPLRSVQKTSALVMSDNSLKTEFVDFIERLNKVSADELMPHHIQLEYSYRVIFHGIARIRDTLIAQRLRTDRAWVSFEQLQSVFTALKNTTTTVLSRPRDTRFVDFQIESFRELLTRGIRLICVLFDHFVTRIEPATGERPLTRAEMVSLGSSIGVVMASAESFHPLITELKGALVAFNMELALAHNRLQLRYPISLIVDDAAEPSDEVEELNE
jgi:hypothetical protein